MLLKIWLLFKFTNFLMSTNMMIFRFTEVATIFIEFANNPFFYKWIDKIIIKIY